MIQGLYIDVSSDEIRTMLQDRLKYHQGKTSFYKEQLAKMQQIDKALGEEARTIGKTSSASPTESLESSVRKHENMTLYYKFMSEHVVPNETYRLGDGELQRLGILAGRIY